MRGPWVGCDACLKRSELPRDPVAALAVVRAFVKLHRRHKARYKFMGNDPGGVPIWRRVL